jgi:hypothetical protein
VYKIKKLKNGQGPTKGCRTIIIVTIIIIIIIRRRRRRRRIATGFCWVHKKDIWASLNLRFCSLN